MDRQRGFTLAEAAFVAAIAAGLVTWGLPAFRDLHRNAARTREVNQLVHAVHYARHEAIKRDGVVSLCPSTDGAACAPGGTPWHRGWISSSTATAIPPPCAIAARTCCAPSRRGRPGQ